jgi:hypothetical protein
MKGFIYIIRSHKTDDVYYGSTDNMSQRMDWHIKHYKCWLNTKNNYITSFDIIKYEDWYVELVEEFEYNIKTELTAREGYYIRNNNCVNKRIEGRTRKEYDIDNKEQIRERRIKWINNNADKIKEQNKIYRDTNRELINEKNKQYDIKNKEQIKEKRKVKYTCKCGSIITICNKALHEKTKKHINFKYIK